MATSGTNPKEIERPASLRHCWVPMPYTERGAPTVIGTHPREKKIIYGSGKNVVVQNLDDPNDGFTYRGHKARVTVAKFAPNGYWVCSGDETGTVRVWSYDHPEHLLKLETQVFAGEIRDIAWGPESKRIIIGGDGSQTYAKSIMWDTGNSVGEMSGHSKRITSVDYKPCRPYRAVTASEDSNTVFYQGPPFRFDHSNTAEHTNFVNCVRFSNNGEHFVSVGSDHQMHLYDGRTGQQTGTFGEGHTGSIYSVAWSPDNTQLLTAGGDRTCRTWDVASLQSTQVFTFTTGADGASQVFDMQVAVAWLADSMISLSLSGDINFLDPANPGTPSRVIQGHQVSITAMSVQPDGAILSASYDGVVCVWRDGVARRLQGGEARSVGGHRGKVEAVLATPDGSVLSAGWDDMVRTASLEAEAYQSELALGAQPCGAAVGDNGTVVVAHTKGSCVIREGQVVWSGPDPTYTHTAVAVSADGARAALGASDGFVRMYTIGGDGAMTEEGELPPHQSRSIVTALAFSPDGSLIAVGDAGRQVQVFNAASREPVVVNKWCYHTTRVTALAWAPDGQHLASGALDEHVFVWDVADDSKRIKFEFTHKEGVSGLAFSDQTTLITSGNDGCVSTWTVTYD